MSAILMAGLFLAQSATITVEANRPAAEIGYRELSAGDPAQAERRIREQRGDMADDPAALINLGSAQARLGDRKAARNSYVAALSSRQRYDLELSDGSWLDSRAAARLAVRMLDKGTTLALR